MRRYAVLASLVLLAALAAPAARAQQPIHIQTTFSGTDSLSAGEFCDFDYRDDFTFDINLTVFPNGRRVGHITEYVTHVNENTNFRLSEVDHIQFQFDPSTGRLRQVGLFYHLRTSGGILVIVQAGQLLMDTTTGEVLKVTPHFNPDAAAVICPALGGHPTP